MRPALFLDTGPLLAAVLHTDPDHEAARALLRRIADGAWRSVHTSDYVLAEAWNFIRMKVKRQETADALHELVFGSERIPPFVDSVVRIHSGRFAQALARYRDEFSRGLSLTDWTSVVAMEDARIDEVATFDGPLKSAAPGAADVS